MRFSWLTALFLACGVLLPAGCVLWFMNAAARSEGAAARASVRDAYRGELRLLRDRADSFWRDRSAAIDRAAAEGDAATFQHVVIQGLADAVLLPHYPVAETQDRAGEEDRPEWQGAALLENSPGRLLEAAARYAAIAASERNPNVAARAAQAQIRCLARSGDKDGALRAIQSYFVAGRLRRQGDWATRSTGADESLFALRLLKVDDGRYRAAAERLAALVNDYSVAMPAAQRLFLMDELEASFPAAFRMPTREAERLTAQVLSTGGVKPASRSLERTHAADVWSLASGTGRVIALYRSATVESEMRKLFAGAATSAGARFDAAPPDAPIEEDAIAAGAELPGWQLSYTLADSRLLDAASQARRMSYLWLGYLTAAGLALTGALVGGYMRRQTQLARLKTDLVAAVSHELRTPLASMRLLVENLMEEPELDRAQVRDYLALMNRENQRLSRMVENFLTFSRIERNRQRFTFAPVAVSDAIAKAVDAMGDRLQPPACELTVEAGADTEVVRADEDALVTALVNLLDNACKYTREPRRIGIRAEETKTGVAIAVEDNGIGIAPREQRRIFRRFYQVDRRLSRETGGCGLGLSIVDFVARAHGGAATVESRPGEGSTFRVTLPRAPRKPAPQAEVVER